MVKPKTRLDIQSQIEANKTYVECRGGEGGGRGEGGGGAGSAVDIRGHGLIACFIYFLMLM